MDLKLPFVVVTLGDNDFCYQMQAALTDIMSESFDGICPVTIKHAMVQYMVSQNMKKEALYLHDNNPINWQGLQHTADYLSKRLRVTFEKASPNNMNDSDGGSVYFDPYAQTVFIY